jgi:hypothetical protein
MYGTAVIWGSKKQPVTAMSTCAAVHINALWRLTRRSWRSNFSMASERQRPLPLLCDDQSTCKVLENPIKDGKSKHLDVHWHYVRERVSVGEIKVM